MSKQFYFSVQLEQRPEKIAPYDDEDDDLEPEDDWGSDETEIQRDNRYER